MKKVQIIAHNSSREEIVGYLQEKGVIHITNLRESGEELREEEVNAKRREKIREFTQMLSKIQFAIDYLAQFEKKRRGLFSLFEGKLAFSPSRFQEITSPDNLRKWEGIADRCRQLHYESTQLEERISKIRAERGNLQAWSKLDVPIEFLQDTRRVAVRVGSIPAVAYKEMFSELEAKTPYFHVDLVNLTRSEAYFVLFFLKEEEQNVGPILEKYGFTPASFPEGAGQVSETLSKLEEEETRIGRQREEIASEAKTLLKHRPKLMAVYDYLYQNLQRLQVQDSFLETQHAFMVEGWVKEGEVNGLRKGLMKRFKEIEVYTFRPALNEEPPVAIENSKLVEPFQIVTNLYGMPRYKEVDPTPLFAPFFAFFLGICLTDMGYGLVLIILSLLALRKFALGKGAKQLTKVLLMSGLMATIVGLLSGEFFGWHMSELLPKIAVVNLRTSEGQEKFLFFCWGIGAVQVWTGFLIKFVSSLRGREHSKAFRAHLPWLLMLPAVVLLLPPGLRRVGLALFVICSLWIIALSDVGSKSIVGRIGNGFFNWYGISGVFGDIFSYSRLFAFGLATGIITQVVNTIAKMVCEIAVVGPALMVVVLVMGHLFNILINGLGGFIHTMRLQFVEYFTKFFEGGGEPFRPFAKESRYTVVMELGMTK